MRLIAATCALLGVSLYSALLPGHLISSFSHAMEAAELGFAAGEICRTESSSPAKPAGGLPSCPFCKGLASFQFACLETPPAVAPALAEGELIRVATGDDIAPAVPPTARNRGPPSSLT